MGNDELPNPFGQLGSDLSDSELRETAYEILIAACRSSGGRPLTYISKAAPERSPSLSSVPSLQRSVTSTAASKVKKALGIRTSKKKAQNLAGQENPGLDRAKKPVTVGELVRVQMRVSEQTDSRIRRGSLRIAAGQLGKRIESIVLPLEQLQHFKPSDFPNQREYESWKRRNLKIIEAGLLLHPYIPLDKQDANRKQLRQIIRGALERPIEIGKQTESMQVLKSTVMSLACRSFDGSVSEICHWADGAPLNLRLYQMLLESCFDVNEETLIVEEVDEVLELVKKTWVILGINEMLHNLCFSWVLFHQYVITSQIENDLLFAANNLLMKVEKDTTQARDSACSNFVNSTLSLILGWAERKLLAYHDTFYSGNVDLMQASLSLAVSAAKILVHDVSPEQRRNKEELDVPLDKVDTYIRSSLHSAFTQKLEAIKLSKRSSSNQRDPLPILSILAQDITELALNEKEIYSPILKQWHPLAAGAAVATLHTRYAKELKQFVSGISELSPDAVQVLLAADKLEKVLVQIAVEDSVDSEDGGKAIIQEMTPYEAETVICGLVKAWIRTRVDRLEEWVDRNLQQEVWNPRANRERFAPSAVEVLRIMDETLEAFFLLPITMHSVLLPDLMGGLDRCLQQYITKAKSGCGTQSTFMPSMPALTRCKGGSKLHSVFRKKEKFHTGLRRKPQVETVDGDDSFGILQLCVRINTMQHIRTQLDVVRKRIINHLQNLRSELWDETGTKFELSGAACVDGIQQLCKATAYKIVFHYLSNVLADSLYVGEVSSSRIEPFLEELERHLEIIAATVHDKVRTRLITDVMRASFEGFLFVLLAGGPSRAFTRQDCDIVEEDFKFLMDLFWSNGDGLPAELVDKVAVTVKQIFPLLRCDTESLIQQFRNAAAPDSDNFSAKPKQLPLPPTTGLWSPTEPNTILRVLCHRNDDVATKFLKKTYNLPKKLQRDN